jgi:hypothetical protein
MIGIKSVGAVGLAGAAIGAAAWRDKLAIDYLSTLGPSSCFAIGLFAGGAAALVAVGWRPRAPSRLAFGVRARRIVLEPPPAPPRELPAVVQRALVVAAFACVGLAVFTNPGTARLVALPASLAEPSAGEYCRPAKAAADADVDPEPAAPAAPVEIPGCALVKRAFALGYTKTLGSCEPRTAPPPVKAAIAAAAPCELRQLDEPFLHFAYRRLSGAGGALAGANPVDAIGDTIDEKQIQLARIDTLIATQRHAVVGTPHASHHVFVTLPDPHPSSFVGDLLDPPHCDARYGDLPPWPAAGATASDAVDHVLGQLLFTARFGTTLSCRDYAVHWSATPTACDELAADPAGFLAAHDLIEPVRDVLDRRRRQIELASLYTELGHDKIPPPPPAAQVLVSFVCLVVDPVAPATGAVTGREVTLDGESVSVRIARVPAVQPTGAGVIELYDRMAALLAGGDASRAVVDAGAPPPELDQTDLSHDEYLLARLDRLHDADPFAGYAWPLDRPDVLEVYPLQRHLGGFIDAFRRRYRAQRGRL